MARPFLETSKELKEGKITWDEYIRRLLLCCTKDMDDGKGEEVDDSLEETPWLLLDQDAFAYSIYCWSGRIGKVNEDDVTTFNAVFTAYRHGSMADVEQQLSVLQSEDAKEIRKSLGLLALQERRSDVLELCLKQGGFPFEGYFEDEADRVDEREDPQTFRVLEQSEFRQIHPRKDPSKNKDANDSDEEEREHRDTMIAAAAFDAGGSYPVNW